MYVGDTDVSVVHRLWPRDRFVVSGFRRVWGHPEKDMGAIWRSKLTDLVSRSLNPKGPHSQKAHDIRV